MAKLKINTGGTVTQGTSKSTAVTCNAPCGQITTHNASLASNTSVGFTVNNSYIDGDDTVNICMSSGGTASSYVYVVDAVAAGSFVIHIRNISGGSLGEALVFNYSIIKNNF